MQYRHVQTGKVGNYVIAWGLLVVLLVAATTEGGAGATLGAAAFVTFIAVIVIIFNRLTVTVGDGLVRAHFGWGWPRRVIETRDITGFRRVRNKWWYGWGVRKVPGGWLWNVWGLDAIEIDLASGKRVRIGTDEPSDLSAALTLHTSISPGA